jgi:hypothetical protein
MQQYSLTRIKERKVNLQNYKEADRRQTCKQLQYLVWETVSFEPDIKQNHILLTDKNLSWFDNFRRAQGMVLKASIHNILEN